MANVVAEGAVIPQQIEPGLLRWRAPHPDWKPDAVPASAEDWEQEVGCVLFEAPDSVVLFDPLLPVEGRELFLAWLDQRVDRRPVSILTTIRWHRRNRAILAERYRPNSSRAWNAIPPGVEQRPLRGAGETLFWLPAAQTLIAGDRLIGAPGGALALCPESWLSGVRVDRAGLAALLRPLVTLPIRHVLPSHGEPALSSGRAALRAAVEEVAGPHDARPPHDAGGQHDASGARPARRGLLGRRRRPPRPE